jgi:2Fe-2S iron-sulfur cluster binding domain
VEEGERLVLAIEEDARVEIMHACGSYAKCSTCRVAFLEGEPEDMTEAEVMKLRPLVSASGTNADDSWRRTRGEDQARAHLDRETLSREAGRRGARLPRDPESLIISATKGQAGTCVTGSQTGEGGKSKDPQGLRSVSVGPLPSR